MVKKFIDNDGEEYINTKSNRWLNGWWR
jgi:hypothetical protein